METMTFDEFATRYRAQGFDEIKERVWPPESTVPSHAHPFAVEAVVVAGEFWLTVGADTRHVATGDTFTLDRDIPHAERYGPDGATVWVARRH